MTTANPLTEFRDAMEGLVYADEILARSEDPQIIEITRNLVNFTLSPFSPDYNDGEAESECPCGDPLCDQDAPDETETLNLNPITLRAAFDLTEEPGLKYEAHQYNAFRKYVRRNYPDLAWNDDNTLWIDPFSILTVHAIRKGIA